MPALASPSDVAEPADRWTAAGLRVACAALLGLYLGFAALIVVSARDGLDPAGNPIGYDFSAFHTAARLAVEGHASLAYDDDAMIAAERAAFPGDAVRLPWSYPPTFLFLLLPLGLLPYGWAWLAWTGGTFACYATTAWRLWPRRAFWPLLLAPAAAVNLFFGQNGLLSATLLGTGVALLARRPLLAGVVLGLMTYKPHLCVLVPLALLAGRAWRALAAMLATASAIAVLSAAVLGSGPWLSFFTKAGLGSAVATASSSNWRAVPSTLVLLRDLGGGGLIAAAAQAAAAIVAAAAVVWVWRRRGEASWRGATLALAALLAAPYLRSYDFALLALPIAALAGAEPAQDWREKLAMAGLWLLPLGLLGFAATAPMTPLLLMLALALVLRRAATEDPSERPSS